MSLRTERARPGLGIIAPCLPSPTKAPPSGPGWLQEIKHDGFRILARKDAAGVRLITRAGNDFCARFPITVMAACQLGREGIVYKRLGSMYRQGRSPHWVKARNPAAPAVKREAEEDWGR